MRSSKWKLSQIVIEGGAQPGCRLMTGSAVSRETGRHVIGVGGFSEVGQMAAGAVGRDALKAITDVASGACQIDVRT